MSIDHGCFDVGVTEQFLDGAQVGAPLQQMRGKRMAQRVRADAEAQAAARDITRHQPVHAARGEASAPIVHEQRLAITTLPRPRGNRGPTRGRRQTAAGQLLHLSACH